MKPQDEEINRIIDYLEKAGRMFFLGPTSKDSIQKFEQQHNVVLPEKYKKWLLFSDGGELFLSGGLQLYGVEHKPVIDMEDDDRPDDSYIIIGRLSNGDPIVCQKEKEEISIYNHEAGRIEGDEVFVDFFDFLDSLNETLGRVPK